MRGVGMDEVREEREELVREQSFPKLIFFNCYSITELCDAQSMQAILKFQIPNPLSLCHQCGTVYFHVYAHADAAAES